MSRSPQTLEYARQNVAEPVTVADRKWLMSQMVGCMLIILTPIVIVPLYGWPWFGSAFGFRFLMYGLISHLMIAAAMWVMARPGTRFTRSRNFTVLRQALRAAALLLMLWVVLRGYVVVVPLATILGLHLAVPALCTFLVWWYLRAVAQRLGWTNLSTIAERAFWVLVLLFVLQIPIVNFFFVRLTGVELPRDVLLIVAYPESIATFWGRFRFLTREGAAPTAYLINLIWPLLTVACVLIVCRFFRRFRALRTGLSENASTNSPS